jgi:hypothetical protein
MRSRRCARLYWLRWLLQERPWPMREVSGKSMRNCERNVRASFMQRRESLNHSELRNHHGLKVARANRQDHNELNPVPR